MVVHNEEKTLRRAIQSAKDLVNEIVIVDQSSTDRTFEIAKELGDIVVRKRLKGNADPDREYCATLARGEWILFLDADEYLSPRLKSKIPKIAKNGFLDVFWIRFENFVDGVNIKEILGDDFHPRLYKKGAVVWLPEAHVYPKIRSPLQGWVMEPIIHDRKMVRVKEIHKLRGQFISPDKRRVEQEFLKRVEALVGSNKR